MDTDKSRGRRLKNVRESKGYSQDKVVREVDGISLSTLQNYEAGKEPTLSKLKKLTQYYKCSLFEILGEGEPFPGARKNYSDVCGPEEYKLHVIDAPSLGEAAEDYDEYVFIRRVTDKISAGEGITPYNITDLKIAFRKDWIKRKGDPKNMSLIKVAGDSMEPTFLAGDLVLIDHKRNRIDPQGGIYALSINDEIMIKRIQVLYPHRKLKIISDNSKYEPIEVELDQVEINGKVIWFGREIER